MPGPPGLCIDWALATFWMLDTGQEPCYRRRTARCRCKFRYVSNFTTASWGFSATSRLSCTVVHQRPFKCWNYTQYADFHGRDAKSRLPGDSRKSRHTTTVIGNMGLSCSATKCYINWSRLRPQILVSKHLISSVTFVCDSQSYKSKHVIPIYS